MIFHNKYKRETTEVFIYERMDKDTMVFTNNEYYLAIKNDRLVMNKI